MGESPAVRFPGVPALARPAGYPHAAEVTGGRTVYVSGQIALDADGNAVNVLAAGLICPELRVEVEAIDVAP